MSESDLRDFVLEILAILEPYLDEAPELSAAVRQGIPESDLEELAELLERAATSGRDEAKRQAFEDARHRVLRRIETESAEREIELSKAESAVVSQFP